MKTLADARDVAEIHRRIDTLEGTLQPLWGRMTAHQVICHASDACRMALGEIDTEPAGGASAMALKLLAVWLPVRWPRGVPTVHAIDQHGGGTPPEVFAADRAALHGLVDRMASATDLHGRVHPVFGPMSRRSWLRWGYLHLDHHLRQFGR